MSKCVPKCVNPTPSQAHCPTCHRSFGGVTGFDAHRRHPDHRGECVDPSLLGYAERAGVWRLPIDEARIAQLASLRVPPRAIDGLTGAGGSPGSKRAENTGSAPYSARWRS